MDVVAILLDVLCLLIEHGVAINEGVSLVLIIHMHLCFRDITKLLWKRLRPYYLASGVCHGTVFHLYTRTRNNLLLLGVPSN